MNYPQLKRRVCKVCALTAAAFILPALAYAGTDNGKGNGGTNNGNQYGKDKDNGYQYGKDKDNGYQYGKDKDNGYQYGKDEDNGYQYGKDKDGDPGVTSTPEANTGIVLVPFFGAVLLFGTCHLLRRQKNASL